MSTKLSAIDWINQLSWRNEFELFSEPYTIVSINTFDDGNQDMENYTNSWFVIGSWKDKVTLRNIANPTIEIFSISKWKTE